MKQRVHEGELRCEQLLQHLERTNSPKAVFLSEDGSGIVKKVVYDKINDQLVGLVLPFEKESGMPIQFSFKAETAEKMKEYLDLPKAGLVYAIVAQPLIRHATPFILQLFGTDNKFEANDVINRWNYTEKELKKYVWDLLYLIYSKLTTHSVLGTISYVDYWKKQFLKKRAIFFKILFQIRN